MRCQGVRSLDEPHSAAEKAAQRLLLSRASTPQVRLDTLEGVAKQCACQACGVAASAVSDVYSPMQLEGIALDPDAENGVASIGSMDANNLAFTQTQATQATQVCVQPQHTVHHLD